MTFIIRRESEIKSLLFEVEELARSEDADGYAKGVLATLHWLTNPERPMPDLYEDEADDDTQEYDALTTDDADPADVNPGIPQ